MIVAVIVLILFEAICAFLFTKKLFEKRIIYTEKERNKYNAYFQCYMRWLKIKQKGRSLGKYFKEHGYYRVAVYGWGASGRILVEELKGTGVEVLFLIDRDAENKFADIPIHIPSEPVCGVDVLVVTPIDFYDEIYKSMKGHADCPIVSLENVVCSI